MSNMRREEVGYRPFDPQPVLMQKILPLERDDGSLMRRVAEGLARIADDQFQRAEQDAIARATRDQQRDVMANRPEAATITGGDMPEPEDVQAGYRTTVAPGNIRAIVTEAAKRNGVDADVLMEVARIETGGTFNPNAKSPYSTAGGLFQFIDGTARQYRLANRYDPVAASDAAARLMSDNRRVLEAKLGRSVTGGELYLAHQQGSKGALDLLGNPNALAVDIVGRDAVLKNGGRADMTAGQFASLWTSKVHDGGVKMNPADADAPVKVTPVRTPLKIDGKVNTWRPTGRNTIYGRTYDVQGTKTYLQLAKTTMLDEQSQIAAKYDGDPVAMKAAMGQLLDDQKSRGIFFDEIAPEYVSSFEQNALGYVEQARAKQEKVRLQQDQADFLGRVSDLEDQKSRMLVGIDPKDPQAATMLDDMQGTIDSHYDSMANRGLMNPVEAERAKRESRSGMTVGFYLKQATGLKADEIEALSTKMATDFAAGNLKGVTAGDWDQISTGLNAALSKRKSEDGKVQADLTKRGDDIFARLLRGEQVEANEIAKFRTDAHLVPEGDKLLASTEARAKLAGALRTQPIGAVEKNLAEILKRPDGKVSAEDTEFARTQIAEVRKTLLVDPLGQAERFGLVPPVPPITADGMTDPAGLRDALSARWGSAQAAARHFGVPVKYFRPGEAEQLQAAAMANPDAMVAFTLNVAQSFGKDTPAAMREISEQGPVMAHAVGLSIATGDASLARDVAKISVMKQKKELDLKLPGDKLDISASATMDGALVARPEMQSAVISTAKLLFEKRAAEMGFDPSKVDDTASVAAAEWEKALDRALGGQVMNGEQYGGLGTVNDRRIVVPAFMKKDQVESLFYGMTEIQLAKLPPRGTINGIAITAAEMKDGYLVSVGDGLYRVATNDPDSDDPGYVIDKAGKPWVLDIHQLEKMHKQPITLEEGLGQDE